MKLNEEQRAAVFCGENAVVAAGAGSGKTMVLARRFAWLVTEKDLKINEILTLTFTTKAAAQMYRRIHTLLAEIAGEETGVKAQRARQALDDFTHARIQTLDSYSTAIVKQGAFRYGISPNFSIDQERCHALALEISLPFLITRRCHPAIERLYCANKSIGIINEFFAGILLNHTRIDKEQDLIGDVKKQFDIVCAEWTGQCGNLLKMLHETGELISDNEALLPDFVPLKSELKNINVPAVSDIRLYFDSLLEMPPETCIEKAEAHPLQNSIRLFLEFLAKINGLNLRKGVRSGNPVKEKIREIRDSFGEFSSLAVYCMQAGFIISITSLLETLQQSYLARKRTEKILAFSDVAQLARTILLEQEDIRQSEKESFKAIMIDEFQDNNELQKEMLFLLAEKPDLITKGIPAAEDLCAGKLFFVGDEKQSIYLFRGADVSVFRKLKTELNSANLPLKTNYRSAPLLIGAFNAIFGGSDFDQEGKLPAAKPSVFVPGENLPPYEASYTTLQAGAEGSGKFSVCILDTKDEQEQDGEDGGRLSPTENEAHFVAARILQLLEEKNETGMTKYMPGDIAILFRTRTSQHLFEKHLRLLDIPYVCEDLNDFFYGGLVNDIMSVLRLAAYPLDSAAYAEMLRSPFAGLSLPGLAACLAVFKKAENPQPFCDEPLSFLDFNDSEKYKNGQKIYALICGKAAKESISSLVSELWYNQGYRYEAEWNKQVSVCRELYDYLFHLAVKADASGQGLAAFTDSITALRDSGERLREIEIPLERSGAVHLLTVHKSKGLEFPVVFLCCCGKRSRSGLPASVFFSDETGIVFSPPLPVSCSQIPGIRGNFFWENISAREKRRKTAELRRLLYVGMTRAEKELYLTGCLDIGSEDDNGSFSENIKNYVNKKTGKDNKWYNTAGQSPAPAAYGGFPQQSCGVLNPSFPHSLGHVRASHIYARTPATLASFVNKNITGDMIIDNDTFLGLCLPAIASYIDSGNDHAFFNLEAIPVYSGGHFPENSRPANDPAGLSMFLEAIEPFYKNAQTIKTPVLRGNHIAPTALHGKKNKVQENYPEEKLFINREFSGEGAADIFQKIDSILARFNESDNEEEKFNWGNFGTIAHVCVEALLKGKEPQIPAGIAGFLTPIETEAFLEAGKELAARFICCPFGETAKNAQLWHSEFPFRGIVKTKSKEEFFIGGTMDLLFEDKTFIHVVDFKTDRRETPNEHIAQMACYYRAANDLFAVPLGKNCRVWLYYLRTGHALELTEKAKNFDLETMNIHAVMPPADKDVSEIQ